MAYTPREIKDRVALGDDIFIIENLGDNRIKLIPAPTHVSEPGTPVNKALLQPIEDYLATGVVPVERTITTGNGLRGGGSLDADRTLSVKFGTTAGTVCEGNDSRLSDARTPTAHNHAAGDLPSTYTLLDHFINSGEIETAQIAGIKNSMFRGKNLGTSYTLEQQSQVASGKFLDLWVGDYWVINDTRYYIAAFNYYLNSGNSILTTNHVTLVPAEHMYFHRMNPANTTEGGYVGSDMYTTGLDQATTKIHADFPGRVLTHRRWLSNATSDGAASGGAWFDSDVELMNEVMVFGSVVNGKGTTDSSPHQSPNIGCEKSQLPLFALRPDLLTIRTAWWLRDVCSAEHFAAVHSFSTAGVYSTNSPIGVRPVFSIF